MPTDVDLHIFNYAFIWGSECPGKCPRGIFPKKMSGECPGEMSGEVLDTN